MRVRALWTVLLLAAAACGPAGTAEPPIKVGILHSQTGTLSFVEKPMVQAELLAIDEVNAGGGLLGRKLVPVVVDARSQQPVFASEAERLLSAENVDVLMCCFTGAARRTVVPIIEKYDGFLVYAAQYEGLEVSPNVLYAGGAPNQTLLPAVKWFLENRGKRFFLVSTDAVYARVATEIMKDHIAYLGGQTVGTGYVRFGETALDGVAQQITASGADVVLSTLNGDNNVGFFRSIRAAGITPKSTPTVSFTLTHNAVRALGPQTAGDYVVSNYVDSLNTPRNKAFQQAYRDKFGTATVPDDPMQSAYAGLYVWAQAVRQAGTTNTAAVRQAIRQQSYPAPEGTVHVDAVNQSLWRNARISRIRQDGSLEVTWTSETLIHPVPYPLYRTRTEWQDYLDGLYEMWGHQWGADNAER